MRAWMTVVRRHSSIRYGKGKGKSEGGFFLEPCVAKKRGDRGLGSNVCTLCMRCNLNGGFFVFSREGKNRERCLSEIEENVSLCVDDCVLVLRLEGKILSSKWIP